MQKSTATVKRRKSSNGKGVESGADTSFSDGHASTSFSLGGQVMTPRRNRLTDEHFQMLLLLRANHCSTHVDFL